jgi:hypothetical protein
MSVGDEVSMRDFSYGDAERDFVVGGVSSSDQMLDPEFEFAFPDGRRERRRIDGQHFDFFSDAGVQYPPKTRMRDCRGRGPIVLRQVYAFRSDFGDDGAIERSFPPDVSIEQVVREVLGKHSAGTVVAYEGREYASAAPISSIPFSTGGEIEFESQYDLLFEVRSFGNSWSSPFEKEDECKHMPEKSAFR